MAVQLLEGFDSLYPLQCVMTGDPRTSAALNSVQRYGEESSMQSGTCVSSVFRLSTAVFFGIATNGGNQALYKAAPTREKADQLLDQRLAAPFPADANDVLYQWDSSRDYNPSAGLASKTAACC